VSAIAANNVTERPAWIPAVRYEALRRAALEEASREQRNVALRQSRALRMTGIVALLVGSAGLIAALWLKAGGIAIALCMALIAAGGIAVRSAIAAAPEDLSRATDEKLALALEGYRRNQLASSDFFHCEAWQALRRSVLERKDARCARCGRKASAMLVVEHIRSRAQAPELALDPANIQILCHACRNTQVAASGTD
jgi:HNH endonuclease